MSAPTPHEDLLSLLTTTLEREGATANAVTECLDRILAAFDCVVGTVHCLNPSTELLELVAQRGVPNALLERIDRIPIGKGMAGLAAERREPVQVCNLQTDDSGVAKPRAKETRMEGSISLPMLVGDELAGTLGVAKPVSYDFTPAEATRLLEIGSLLGSRFLTARS